MNPFKLIQLKTAWSRFSANHPKFPHFLSSFYKKGMKAGTVIEFHVTTPEGESISANLKIKEEDLALFQELKELLS